MGRPPLDAEEKTVKTTLRFTRSWLKRIDAVAGSRKAAAFIRDTVEAEVERLERRDRAAKRKPDA